MIENWLRLKIVPWCCLALYPNCHSQSAEVESHRKYFWSLILISSEGTRGATIGVSHMLCWNILWFSVHINCDIWLQVQAMDLDAISLTAWKYLKSSDSQMQTFHEWQDFCTQFTTAAKKKKKKKNFFLKGKHRNLSLSESNMDEGSKILIRTE